MKTLKSIATFFLFLTCVTIFSSFKQTKADIQGKHYALVIGIDNYEGNVWNTLKTPVNDVRSLRDILMTKYDFEEIVTLLNEEATRENIIDYIDRIANNLREEDSFLLFFSGHGIEIGSEGYWVPADAKTQERYELVPNSEIKNAISKTESKHVLVMVDACFSSTIFKSSNLFIPNDGTNVYYDKVEGLVSRQAITAGGLEPVPDGKGDHSIFAKYMLKFLEKNENPHLDAGELFEMLKYPVAANSPNIPQFGHIQNTGHEGGQFIFKLAEEKSCSFEGVTIKEGSQVTFGMNGGTIHAETTEENVTYQWIYNSSPLAEQSNELKVDKRGIYTVAAVSENGECSEVAVIEVEIELPKVDIVILEGNEAEFTYEGTLTASTTADDVDIEYEWKKNNYIIGNTPSIKVTQSGIYTITARLKDGRELAKEIAKVTVGDRLYKVRIGDNVERIANKFYGSAADATLIYEANKDIVTKGEILRVGLELKIPAKGNAYQSEGQIKISGFDSFAPFSSFGIYNNGMLTDILETSFEKFGQDVFVDFSSGSKSKSMAYSGRSKAAFPYPRNAQDENLFYYSNPIFEEITLLFVQSTNKDISFSKDKDLKGKTIAVIRGFEGSKLTYLKDQKIIGMRAYGSLEECYAALKAGEVDIVAAPQSAGIYAIQNSKTFTDQDFRTLKKPLEKITLHMIVSKENPDAKAMLNEFNKALNTLKSTDEYENIINTHLDKIQN